MNFGTHKTWVHLTVKRINSLFLIQLAASFEIIYQRCLSTQSFLWVEDSNELLLPRLLLAQNSTASCL